MNEKVFNLLEKLYVEFTEFKDEMTTFKGDMTKKVTKIEATLESDIKPDVKLALQGFVDSNEKLNTLENRINKIFDRVDRHDMMIKVIEGTKRA